MSVTDNWDDIDPTKPVKVYRNLHKNCWSVKQGKIILHTDRIVLKNAIFKVWEGGRARVLRENRKNVHAFVIGTICKDLGLDKGHEVTYNPYSNYTFVYRKSQMPIEFADLVIMDINASEKVLVP